MVLFEGKLVADRLTSESTPRDVVELTVGASNQEQITPVIWALESYHKAQQQTEELFQEQAKLHETLEASDLLNRQLIERLSGRVKAMDRLNAALQETQRRLKRGRAQSPGARTSRFGDPGFAWFELPPGGYRRGRKLRRSAQRIIYSS